LVFPLNPKHNHAPGIVELPNGDLLASWYRGSGERSADDVAVLGARLPKGSDQWGPAQVWADTPGFPDGNTALFLDRKERLWLFWPQVLANTWESCITNYRISKQYASDGAPVWDWQGTILLKPVDFEKRMNEAAAREKVRRGTAMGPKEVAYAVLVQGLAKNKLNVRLGWQTRCKPIQLPSGRILLPLYSDTFSACINAISDDDGQTWFASQPMIGFGNIQATLLRRNDGSIVAYMRENGPLLKIRVSESTDDGMSWSPVTEASLPNPGAGVDGVRLENGHWALIYNDQTEGRNQLAVSISDDEGKSWKWTRHVEKQPKGSFHYPAIIQGKDGTIHAIYSYFVEGGKSMKHAAFNEAWILQGDK
jgi:predicted neuraminidase